MKRILLTALALAGAIGAAHAAGMVAPHAAGTAAQPDWSGFYAGINGGYSRGAYNYDDGSETIDLAGMFAGAQVGYNFVLGGNMVLGLQVDGDWSDQNGTFSAPAFGFNDNFRTDFSGAATGRLGLALGNLMPYVLGGVAIAHGTESYTSAVPFTSNGTASGMQVGLTAGLGAEAKVSDTASAFLEARYVAYHSSDFPGTWSSGSGIWTLSGNESDWSIRTGLNWHY